MERKSVVTGMVIFLLGCSAGENVVSPDTSRPVDIPVTGLDSWSFSTLGTVSYPHTEHPRSVSLIKAEHVTGTSSYMLYVPSAEKPAPLIILNEPYTGIGWTDDPVDLAMAVNDDGVYPDVYGPDYNGIDEIRYTQDTIQKSVSKADQWMANGYAVAITFGRFYAGGSLANDVQDAVTPYFFAAAHQAEIDIKHIASSGGSWGGLMALFGAYAAPPEVKPEAVAALSAPNNIPDLLSYVSQLYQQTDLNQDRVRGFYSPYLRRINVSDTTSPVEFDVVSTLTAKELCEQLPDNVFLAHDEWDTLIPLTQTSTLEDVCGEKVKAVYWLRGSPADINIHGLNHGTFSGKDTYADVYTFRSAWILGFLDRPQTTTFGSRVSIRQFLTDVQAAQSRGENVDFSWLPLNALIAPGLSITEESEGRDIPGIQLLTPLINEVFNLRYSEEALRQVLQQGLLPF
jgi:hypothetical protein